MPFPTPPSPGTGLRALLDLALPAACAGCDRTGQRWCRRCRAEIEGAVPAPWAPSPVPSGFPVTWSALPYAGSTRSAIVAWKDADRADLLDVWVPVLRATLAAALQGQQGWSAAVGRGVPVRVVPMPSARSGTRRRGRAPVTELARAVLAGVPEHLDLRLDPALRMVRAVRDQAGLSARERSTNLRGAMALAPRHTAVVRGAYIVLVDDVVTTGATLVEGARALHAAGAGEVLALTLAATRRHRPGAVDAPGRVALPGRLPAV